MVDPIDPPARSAPSVLWVIALLLSCACVDAVAYARADSAPAHEPTPKPLPIPADLDLTADRQTCTVDTDCVVVRGVPGQNFTNLCCATCDAAETVLATRYAERLAQYKRAIGCAHAVCPPRGDCPIEVVSADCWAGKCRRRVAP